MPIDNVLFRRPQAMRRLTLQKQTKGWAIISDTSVGNMTPPPHHELPYVDRAVPVSGSWIELFDAKGAVLYRRRVQMPDEIETFDAKGRPFRRTLPEPMQPDLNVLIPDLRETAGIALFHSPPPAPLEGRAQQRSDRVPVAVFSRRRFTRSAFPLQKS